MRSILTKCILVSRWLTTVFLLGLAGPIVAMSSIRLLQMFRRVNAHSNRASG